MMDWHVEKFRSAAISLQSNGNTPSLKLNDRIVVSAISTKYCASASHFNLRFLPEKFDRLRLPALTG